jgi:hypothetical protein
LKARERHYIESLECVNLFIPGRTKKECDKAYYEKNKEEIAKKQKLQTTNHKQQF